MRRSAQGPHMHMEFVGQDLKRHSIRQRPLRFQRPRLANDSLWRGRRPASHARNVSRATPSAVAHSA
jgi:hypothetical protein